MRSNRIQPVLPILSPLIAIAAALIFGAGLIVLAGKDPVAAYSALFQESLADYYGFGNTSIKNDSTVTDKLGRTLGT